MFTFTLSADYMENDLLLDITGLSVSFKNEGETHAAVDNISFRVGKGRILGLVGESGSGKSVTALSILKLIPSPPAIITARSMLFRSSSNEILQIESLDERSMRRIRGKEISMIFQEPMTSLNPVYTCGNQVVETIRQHLHLTYRQAKEKTLSLFEEVRLPDPEAIFRSFPHEISGGQKQRVMIAMAVSCDPSLLIADEPTTALDVSVQRTILDLLKRMQETRNMAIMFITHDLGLIRGFADTVMVMYKGKIAEEGPVARIFGNPENAYTQGLLACRPPVDIRLRQLSTIEDFMTGGGKMKSVPVPDIISGEERRAAHQVLYRNSPILEVEDLSKTYSKHTGIFSSGKGEYKALREVSVQVYPGETLGIVGESGCGKTTLARVVLQLIPPTAGRILYKGEDITVLTTKILRKLRKEVQIVFQDPYSSLNPRRTIGAAIMEPMKVHNLFGSENERRERTAELLQQVGLDPGHFYRYPHEFSGGQRQRICIARALAVEPEMIILDESVSALDVSVQAQVLNLLNDLKKRYHLTYMFISHDLSVVKYMSDRVIVMKEGRIEEAGEADEVYSHPASAYTKMLLAASAII
jgi:peptide/nickel transport system ATP-binding protein